MDTIQFIHDILCNIMTMAIIQCFGSKSSEKQGQKRYKTSCKQYYRYPYKSRPAQIVIIRVKRTTSLALMANNDKVHNTFDPDFDSFAISINTHPSFSMSNNCNHFLGPIKPSKSSMLIGVINGSLPILGSRSIKWNITDNYGKQHVFKIPNTLYVPGMKTPTLTPQHWAL